MKTSVLLMALLSGTVLAGGAGAPPVKAPLPSTTKTFSNPVLDVNFPDPFILKVGSTYHAYATNGAGSNVQHAVSRDLIHWKMASDVLPQLPNWVQPGLTWAPEVSHLGGKYQLYYTARDLKSDKQCVGVAVSGTPSGPFFPAGGGPIVCQAEQGGTIDPSPFVDQGGQAYLLFKNDGNCCNMHTNIYIQPLTSDGLHLKGKPTALIQNFQLWEGNVVEAPTLHKQGGVYYLLYSGGPYDSDLYAVGYATSKSITGPYKKAANNPAFVSRGVVAGPGHQSVFNDASGQTWLVYHAWTAGQIGDSLGYRSMRLDKVTFSGGVMKSRGPTVTPQPAPSVAP